MTDGDNIACDCGEKTVILPVHNKLLQTSDQISNQPKKDKVIVITKHIHVQLPIFHLNLPQCLG